MKTQFLATLFVFFGIIILISGMQACKKSGDSDSFTWTWNGSNYTGNYKEAFIQSLGSASNIIGGTGSAINSSGSGPRISVSSLAVGTYSLTGSFPNTIYFVDPNGDNLGTTTGVLNITSNTDSKLSGNFSATLINAASQTTSISGSFSNIKISP